MIFVFLIHLHNLDLQFRDSTNNNKGHVQINSDYQNSDTSNNS